MNILLELYQKELLARAKIFCKHVVVGRVPHELLVLDEYSLRVGLRDKLRVDRANYSEEYAPQNFEVHTVYLQ